MVLATVSLARGAWTPPAQVLKGITTHVTIIPSDLKLVLSCQPPHLDRMLHGHSYSRIGARLHVSLLLTSDSRRCISHGTIRSH